MTQYKRIAIDTSKAVFTLHGIDLAEKPVLRVNLSRAQLLPFSKKLPPLFVAMEACGGSHRWGRELTALGHRVLLVPPQYVKPYVKRGKNDRNDAAAICEAAGRPGMSFVPVKSAETQAQAMVMLALLRRKPRKVAAVAPRLRKGKPGQQDGAGRLGHDEPGRNLPPPGGGSIVT